MSSITHTVAESYPMNGGDDPYSYARNSLFQVSSTLPVFYNVFSIPALRVQGPRTRTAASAAKTVIDDAIAEKLDLEKIRSASDSTFRVADMGCSVGPNTFIAMQNIINAVQHKYQSQGLASHVPEFHVFFSDHASNDFNTLFTSLPPERPYFAAGVPGSFYGRLFPESSLHFVHASYALHFLSEVPAELLNKNSPAWNKGRIHYSGAPNDVARAYTAQFSRDISTFLDARAEEVTVGGMMVLIIPAIPDGIPHSCVPGGVLFDFLGLSLMDMAKEGLISEAEVDSFNMPLYATSAREMTELVAKNGRFNIDKWR
ncbi:putative S-adenosylmethionine-dependent methyltransferase At5g38100 [Morella rubra]|uniref:Putative S-adenosylmethionine-dependent methyltransferase At5g38100 n=1 Tax=Morella rubra TaxID=262757 RepID=A0A6A1UZP1_9ROSI|nr:putative S-adenosylmethionine-dependent methyltransferase At5g38100 [Morella rubra]